MGRFLIYFVTSLPFLTFGLQGQDTDSPSATVTDNIPIAVSSSKAVYSGNIPSLRAIENGYEMWVVTDHSKDRSVTYRESRQLWRFRCADREAGLASWVNYSVSGKILSRGTVDQYLLRYEPVVPGSVIDGLMKFACEYGPLKIEQ
jgi:hypothetical protein